MHVLHLPPRHLWRITALAAALAVLLSALIVLPLSDLSSGGGSGTGASTATPPRSGVSVAPAQRPPLAPAWQRVIRLDAPPAPPVFASAP